MTIALIRHGATDSNGARYLGRQDTPLNARGRQQAVAVAARLARRRFDRIWTSPLSRAVATARPLAQAQGLDPVHDAALLEFDFGDWAGREKPDVRVSLRRCHAFEPVKGGESLHDVWCRLETFAATVLADDRQALSIAIIGHYWSLRLLRGRLLGRAFEETLADRSYKPAHAEVCWLTRGA